MIKKILIIIGTLFIFLPLMTYAGGPAARIGDPTSHGGIITTGKGNVLIEGKPAATIGDYATCPLGGYPTPPHIGGPISTGSSTVLINGSPAAHTGSLVIENSAISTVIGGASTVNIGD